MGRHRNEAVCGGHCIVKFSGAFEVFSKNGETKGL